MSIEAWMLIRKRDGFIRGVSQCAPSEESLQIAAIDGDEYVPMVRAAQLSASEEARKELEKVIAGQREHIRANSGRWADYESRRITELEERCRVMQEALTVAVKQNSHDMLMTGEEIRACEAALSHPMPDTQAEGGAKC